MQASASLTSAYTWELPDKSKISMGNMLGYYQTLKLKIGEYSFDPGIKNTIIRNGLLYAYPISLGSTGRKFSLEVSYGNTRFFGSKTYTRDQHEFGIAIGNRLDSSPEDNILRAGLTYVKAKDSEGIRLTLGYWF